MNADPRELVRAAVDGARKLEMSRAEPSSGRAGVRVALRIRIRRRAPMIASPLRPAPGPPRPTPGADVLERFGWSGPEAEWIALVCRRRRRPVLA